MKKLFITLIVLLFIVSSVKSQSKYTDAEWNKLVGFLSAEQWGDANTLSLQILKRIPAAEIDSDDAAAFRYMYIYSEAGLMNERKVTKEQAQKKITPHIGHKVLLAAHPITSKQGFNSITLVNDKTDTLMVTATNKTATQIFSFEYIIPKKRFPLDEFKNNEGKFYGVIGRIKSIKAGGDMFPRFQIYVDEAEMVAR
ncbi:hypothetical protein ACFQZI_13710 [Mucilaginibacter lutimaris]|uniref:DUF4468 domain-containing protein n=1 Tax=Mucilaginibacter lutimaris TaxID=931629 RepID=A0ABW2ZIB3_9SPHI